MSNIKHALLSIAMLAIALGTQAKREDVYLFSIATSFNDSLVYITDIQEVKQAYLSDDRNKFLTGRNNYSYQLRDYLAAKGHANRTVATFWATSRKDIEKKYEAVQSKYAPGKKKKKAGSSANIHELHHLTSSEFAYTLVEPDEGVVYVDAAKAEAEARKSKNKKGRPEPPQGAPQGMPPGGGQPPMGGMSPK